MGGVLSSVAVSLERARGGDGRALDVVSWTMVHTSVVGGLTLCFINLLSAWRCSQRATELLTEGKGVGGRTFTDGAACLSGYCWADNVGWGLAAVGTAVLGTAASAFRSRVLVVSFMLLWAARGLSCVGEMTLAAYDFSSCSAWALRTTYWIPVVSLSSSLASIALGAKFSRMLKHHAAHMKGGSFMAVDLRELECDLAELEQLDKEWIDEADSGMGYDVRASKLP